MTDSLDPTLQILPTPKKRASYRPAALRTNSHTRRRQHSLSSPTTAATTTTTSSPNDLLSRRSTNTSSASTNPNQVTRRHWVPDSQVSMCATCPTQFSMFERKHHCRKCGHIFCHDHSNYTVALSRNADFSVTGIEVKSCVHCRREYELWLNPVPQAAVPSSAGGRAMRSQGVKGRSSQGGAEDDGKNGGIPQASVPTDWTWSTF